MKTYDEALTAALSAPVGSESSAETKLKMENIESLGMEIAAHPDTALFIKSMIDEYRQHPPFDLMWMGRLCLSCFSSGVRVGIEMEKIDG